MSSLDNLRNRVNYAGGANQEARMNNDKLRSLKKALLYSYQGQTAILNDGREFRCLINHDKLKEDYDDKIISIPYKDICLNREKIYDKTHEGEEEIGMKVGDTFLWKETNSRWIVIQEILEENAYFRATIRKAEDEVIIDGRPYYGYLGKWTKGVLWHTKQLNSWSEMGYEVVLYITRDETTEKFFHRFQKVNIRDRVWEVQMVNDISSETLLIVYLKETFTNEFDPVTNTTKPENTEPSGDEPIIGTATIIGKDQLYPFDKASYAIENAEGGSWSLSNTKGRIDRQTDTTVDITITSPKSGAIDLIYKREGKEDIVKNITIKSL
jgi:hypothetical protein